jgi:hypothetical protein
MTRKSVLLILLLLFFFVPLFSDAGIAVAGSRFDSGFRGIAWGSHKEHLPDLGLSPKALKNVYRKGPSSILFMQGKGNLAMNFDGLPLLSIFLHFQDQLFHGVDFVFQPEDRDKIHAIISAETGSKGVLDTDNIRWSSDRLDILLTDRELMIRHVVLK